MHPDTHVRSHFAVSAFAVATMALTLTACSTSADEDSTPSPEPTTYTCSPEFDAATCQLFAEELAAQGHTVVRPEDPSEPTPTEPVIALETATLTTTDGYTFTLEFELPERITVTSDVANAKPGQVSLVSQIQIDATVTNTTPERTSSFPGVTFVPLWSPDSPVCADKLDQDASGFDETRTAETVYRYTSRNDYTPAYCTWPELEAVIAMTPFGDKYEPSETRTHTATGGPEHVAYTQGIPAPTIEVNEADGPALSAALASPDAWALYKLNGSWYYQLPPDLASLAYYAIPPNDGFLWISQVG